MKITADTNFLVSATQWDNSVAHKLLIKLIEINAEVFTTKEILGEFSEVPQRDFKYSEEEADKIIEKILSFIILIEPKIKADVVKEDPDDNIIIECALESKSKYIITYDRHLLKIKDYQGIEIIKPEEAMKIL